MKAMNTLLIGLGALAVVGSGFALVDGVNNNLVGAGGATWTPGVGYDMGREKQPVANFGLVPAGTTTMTDSMGRRHNVTVYKVDVSK